MSLWSPMTELGTRFGASCNRRRCPCSQCPGVLTDVATPKDEVAAAKLAWAAKECAAAALLTMHSSGASAKSVRCSSAQACCRATIARIDLQRLSLDCASTHTQGLKVHDASKRVG